MEKIKKLFNSIILCFSLLGTLCLGFYFSNPLSRTLNAALTQYDEIENSIPEYLKINKSNETDVELSEDNSVFLIRGEGSADLNIANSIIEKEFDEVDSYGEATGNKIQKRNYTFFPNENQNDYYYFRFTSALSLYHNITNKDNADTDKLENLLEGQLISNFAKTYESDTIEPFYVNGIEGIPQRFDISFGIQTSRPTPEVIGNKVILNKEGLYTLYVTGQAFHTTDDGTTFSISDINISYTFMIFNYDTYFDSGSKLPLASMSRVQETPLAGSATHSKYFFYNYTSSTAGNLFELPTYRYNPNKYQMTVTFTDTDNNNYISTIEYSNGKIEQKDQLGNVLSEKNLFVLTRYDEKNNELVLTFNDLGQYDLSFEFVYKSTNGMFELPLSSLRQRLYIYGYQTLYTDYSDVDDETMTTRPKELKEILANESRFQNSADITERVLNSEQNPIYHKASAFITADPPQAGFVSDTYQARQLFEKTKAIINPKQDLIYDAQTAIETAKAEIKDIEQKLADGTYTQDEANSLINQQNKIIAEQNKIVSDNAKFAITPISTNQTPIKFRSNASGLIGYTYKLKNDKKIWDKNAWEEPTQFTGTNINEAGTYLIFVDYNFTGYMSNTGTNQATHHHFQVFYFTVENKMPTVTVVDVTGKEIYTKGYTNKDVYVLDNSASTLYDADVEISLDAYDYTKGNYFFQGILLNDPYLTSRGITYFKDQQLDLEGYQGAPQTGIRIDASSRNAYRNATFTVNISTKNTSTPSTRSFTIDTNEISDIKAFNVKFASSSSYTIEQEVQGNMTNQSVVFSWQNKLSGAQTYGYYKYFPIETVQYYKTADQSSPYPNSLLLYNLMDNADAANILPVNALLNLAQNNEWVNYTNAYEFTNSANALKSVPSTYARSSAGIYLFEVYDDAGNVNFELYLVDNTSPIFVKKIVSTETGSANRAIAEMNETITVSEANNAYIIWAKYKGIYIQNYNLENILNNLNPINVTQDAKNDLSKIVENFFLTNSTNIRGLSGSFDKNGEPLTYSSQYLKIEIDDDYYYRHAEENSFTHQTGTSYKIEFFKKNQDGEQEAVEGTYKFFVRDNANSQTTPNNPEYEFINQPSGYLAINVSADASEVKITKQYRDTLGNVTNSELDREGYTLSGPFYEDENEGLVKNKPTDDAQPKEGLAYKYSYYRPIKTTDPITLSFKPAPSNGSIVESVILEYYPYVKDFKNITAYKHGKPFTATAWYYKLADKADRTIPIYTYSASDGYTETDIIERIITFDGSNTAAAGKYVITRKYSTSNTIDKYDYYERTLTLYVDRFNVISPQEVVNGKTETSEGEYINNGQTSLESIVGGDILISMYSLENQNQIQISFPNYDNTDNLNLNNGSFYTKGDTTTVNPVLSTNKLPFNVLVPQYKYTDYYTYDTNTNSYTVKENQSLSHFGDAYLEAVDNNGNILTEKYDSRGDLYFVDSEGKNAQLHQYILYVHGIKVNTFTNYGRPTETKAEAEQALSRSEVGEYRLHATITRTWQVGNEKPNYEYYATNGTGENGYLNFYKVSNLTDKIPVDATPVQTFKDSGRYDVTIYQSYEQGVQSEFYNFYRFAFEIENAYPEFDILTGEEVHLNSTDDVKYYTNTKDILIRWEDSDSEFIANIDKTKIQLRKNGSTSDIIPVSVNDIVPNGRTHTISIDLNKEMLWLNGKFLQITMQFEGHNEFYYTTTKNVHVDYSAPIENLKGLMENIENLAPNMFTRLYQERNMRELCDSNGNIINTSGTSWSSPANIDQNMQNVSYSYSAPSGTMRYYAYNANIDYLKAIKNSINLATANEVQFIYTRQIDSLESYTQVNKESFSPLNYIALHNLTPEIIDMQYVIGNYYEVVEQDSAGNMTVYLIHLYDDKKATTASEDDFAIKYTNERETGSQYLSDRDLDSAENFAPNSFANIYSSSGFKIQGLNYLSDPWGIYNVIINGNRHSFMNSPWVQEGELVEIIQSGSNIRFETVQLASLFNNVPSSKNKHTIELNNRYNGTKHNVLVSIMDGSLIITKSSSADTAVLNIQVPSAENAISVTEATIFPTSIELLHFVNNKWQPIRTFINKTGDPNAWISEDTQIAFSYANNILSIRVNLASYNSQKLMYKIKDNFNQTTTVIQIANEETCEEVSGESYITFNEPNGSVTYLSAHPMTYQYNKFLHHVEVGFYNGTNFDYTKKNYNESSAGNSTSINRISFTEPLKNNYNYIYQIMIYDADEWVNTPDKSQLKPIRTIQIKFYYSLPQFIEENAPSEDPWNYNTISFKNKNNEFIKANNSDPNRPTLESLTMNGITYTDNATLLSTYSSNVTLSFTPSEIKTNPNNAYYLNEYSYSVYLTTDGENYTLLNEYASGYRISGAGNYKVLVIYDDSKVFPNECKIFNLTIIDSSSVFYTVLVDGEIITRNDIKYTINGREYTENYIVSVDYSERGRVLVKENESEDEEMKTTVQLYDTQPTGTNVYIEIYTYSSKISSGRFTIIYMGETNNIINREKLSYDDASGTPIRINPTQATTLTIVADETQVDYSKLRLTWNAYYGISVNKINIEISKLFNNNFVPIELTIYSSADGEDNYTYITRSGTYRIRFYDSCQPANNQIFGSGNYLNLVFLKEVPFTITYQTGNMIEVDGQQVPETKTTEPIQKAVYNGEVKLNLVNLSSYYQTLGYPVISVTKDGKEYQSNPSNYVYTFNETGYYTVKFAATSAGGTILRQEAYSFTIINPTESRFSYEFASYSSYYVESVIKDGQDITQNLVDFASGNSIIVDNKIYLSRLLVSYFDERTGAGRYTISINTGDKNYHSNTTEIVAQRYTFSFWINMATPPISVSLAEGESTTKNITISFNAFNLYDAVGDCFIQIGNERFDVNPATLESLGGENCRLQITKRGTYYIQIYTTSKNLLYSYKVTKTDPLNTWAIIAIVFGVLAVGVVVFITIKLRKRLKVK